MNIDDIVLHGMFPIAAMVGFFGASFLLAGIRSPVLTILLVGALWTAWAVGTWFIDVSLPLPESRIRSGEPASLWLSTAFVATQFAAIGGVAGTKFRTVRAQPSVPPDVPVAALRRQGRE